LTTRLAVLQRLQLLSVPVAADAGIVRAANDQGARLVSAHPDRFGLLAALPMSEPELAVGELNRASDELGADGFVLVTNYGGAYLRAHHPRPDARADELALFRHGDRRVEAVSLVPALEVAGGSHLVFGTDFPPAGTDVIDATITSPPAARSRPTTSARGH
jgi:predicted TIM-barrel fold metal-dependent hydrolase